jgi:hypothetical protein
MQVQRQLLIGFLATAVIAANVPWAAGGIRGPYTVDANTMHLWHLDETDAPAADAAHYNYQGTPAVPDANLPLQALFGATLGTTSFTGFGTALDQGAGAQNAGLSALPGAADTTDNVVHTFDHPTTHAFSMEAIIKIGFDTTAVPANHMEIIAGEGDEPDSSDRSWQFRIQSNPDPANQPWVLRFQKVSGFGGVGGSTANYNLDANIPNSGIDAIAFDQWYHVAVTYNGDLADEASLKLYWTKLDAANTEAKLIGNGNMNGWLRQQDTDFALGNELRDFNGNTEGFFGLIDEVRISDIARAPTDFQFTGGAPVNNANFDGDADVDGADFITWQKGVGRTGAAATAATGNANGDATIDAADLAIWRTQFGQPVAGLAAGAVPEPGGAVVAWCSILLGAGARSFIRRGPR